MTASSAAPRAGYEIAAQADLGPLNTFRVPVRTACLATLHDAQALAALFAEPLLAEASKLFVLGGGSNVLFTRDFDGAVLRVASRGIEVIEETAAAVGLRVAAGENWDGLVRWTLRRGLAGLENLILIPGTVGAAPIQNIGAYGVELDEFVTRVEAWDFARRAMVRLEAKACGFGYRDSRFKREAGRYLVAAVELELPRERELRLDYAGVRDELAAMAVGKPAHADVARAVERLRRRKLPDPAEIGNAGSFFKNPILGAAEATALQSEHPDLRMYRFPDGRTKLSAAAMIEACGFKGRRDGRVGVSHRHALVLVNHGGASGAEVWVLAERIRAAVQSRFGIMLEPEPRIL
ncbi:MAG: UDP-N-acetylmuramate dehydrogenase [Gammaproteobacteria bacterium]|nr:UDP-N-acetylmuramate dehydrogenase [Gammaproteobacteria bacterium]